MLTADEGYEGYVIDATLGRGGYATVYRAHRAGDPNHVVALKILDEDQRHETKSPGCDANSSSPTRSTTRTSSPSTSTARAG